MTDRRAIFIAVLVSAVMHALLLDFGSRAVSFSWFDSKPDLWSTIDEPDPESLEPLVEIPEPPLPIIPPEMDQLGELDGTGTALDTIEFPDPQQANQIGAEQAALTQAISTQRRSSETNSSSLGPVRKRQQFKPTTPSKPIDLPDENPQAETGIDQPSDQPDAVDSKQTEGADNGQTEADQSENSSDQADATSSNQVESNNTESVGPDFNASDQDSDPFSAEQAYEFRPGGTRARGGRDVKMKRPNVDLQFRADVTRLGTPIGILTEITIDKDSKPIDVVIIKSSGSQAIDDSVRLAIFRSTFGQPAPATFRFGVLFY